jgi:DNA-directed RNA polymerase specialized sigma24 family protein
MEEINAMRSGVETQPIVSKTSHLLTSFIEAHAESLMGILRSYVSKRRLASNEEEVREVAVELLHEVYLEATKTSAHFDPTRSPQAWLLGIAVNILNQKKT